MAKNNSGRTAHKSVTDRGHSRRHETAENHLDARSFGPKSKGQKRKEAFARSGIPQSFMEKQERDKLNADAS